MRCLEPREATAAEAVEAFDVAIEESDRPGGVVTTTLENFERFVNEAKTGAYDAFIAALKAKKIAASRT